MDMLSFLYSVLPNGEPTYVGLYQDRPKHFKQFPAASIEELASKLAYYTSQGLNTYFGISGYKEGWHQATPNAEKQSIRTIRNTTVQRIVWLDVDVGKVDVPSYPDKSSAMKAIGEFIHTYNIPVPTIVDSGNGLHIYWRFSKNVDVVVWTAIAYRLVAAGIACGFKIDAGPSVNILSSPRPVGSWNIKETGAHPVKLLHMSQEIDPEYLLSLLPEAMVPDINITTPIDDSHIPESLRGNATLLKLQSDVASLSTPKDPIAVVAGCKQVRDGGISSYPTWFNMMVVLSHCENGELIAKELSKRDQRFNEDEFSLRYSQAAEMDGGPTACFKFQIQNPAGCIGCPHSGKIKSPIVLGMRNQTIPIAPVNPVTVPQSQQPTIVQSPVVLANSPAPAAPYLMFNIPDVTMIHNDGLYSVVTDVDGNEQKNRLLGVSFYFAMAQLYRISYLVTKIVYIVHVYTNGIMKQVQLSADDLTSDNTLRRWCINSQLLPTTGNEKKVFGIMKTWISQIQNSLPQVNMHEHFGWSNIPSKDSGSVLGFVVGDRLLTKGVPPSSIGISDKLSIISNDLSQSGTLEEWKKVPAFYHRNNLLWAQFGLCLAFGAPLMYFAPGNANNGLVHFWSADSGIGKTALQVAINSVWGNSNELLITPRATDGARYAIVSLLRNMPATINEITNLDEGTLSEMLFCLSEGAERERLNADASLKKSGNWKTITVTSANTTVVDKMRRYAPQREGEIKRVLEVQVPTTIVPRDEANEFSRIAATNFGHAGQHFIQYLLDNGHIPRIPKILEDWVSKNSRGSDERFWENIVATALIGGSFAKLAGLIDFDMSAVQEYAFTLLEKMRVKVAMSRSDGVSDMAEFLNQSLRDTLIVESATRTGTNTGAGNGNPTFDPYVKLLPKNELNIRIERDTGNVYVSTTAFKRWCKDNNKEVSLILSDLTKARMYDPSKRLGNSKRTGIVKKRMAAGGIYGLADSSPIACYEITGMSLDTVYDGDPVDG